MCNGHMFIEAIFLLSAFQITLNHFNHVWPLVHETHHRNDLDQEAVHGDDHDRSHSEYADKDSLSWISTLKSFQKYYFKLILMYNPF